MSKKNQAQPKSILEALGDRATEDENVPEPTMDETVMEALADDKIEEMIGEKPPQIPPHLKGSPPIQPPSNEAREKIEKAVEKEMTMDEIIEKCKRIKEEGGKQVIKEMTQEVSQALKNTLSLQNREKPTIPASNIESQPAIETSSQDSQEQTPQSDIIWPKPPFSTYESVPQKEVPGDENLRRLQEFVDGDTFNVNWVRSRIACLSQFPEVLPSPISWDIPGSIDLAELIYNTITGTTDAIEDYVEQRWPALQILMNKSVDNVEWTAGILCTIALFDVICMLPFLKEELK